jgi:pilus assembly protein CpaE
VSFVETLLVLDDSLDQAVVQSSLPVGGKVRAVRLGHGAESVLAALDGVQPDLIVVGSASMSDEALEVIRGARRRHGESAIVVLHAGSANGYLERAFSAGADDLITLPQGRDAIAFALEKAMARRRRVTPTASRSPMICIIGPKGGTGKTLTACNLAVALALAGKRPVIVDIDLQFGDVGIALGLTPEHTIYDLVVSPGPIDVEKVGRFLTHHSSGADVLLAPTRPDQAGAIGPDLLREIFTVLRSLYDFVIVDTPPAFTPEVIASIDASTSLCVVGMLDALSLKDTKIGLETLALMGYDLDDVQLVLNRADTSVGISDDDVTMILGRRPDVFVPSDRAVPRAITDGLPIVVAAERSGPAKAFFSLANLYLGADSTESGSTEAPARAKETPRGSRRSLFARGQ